jgi:phosphomethylpyrimidine synthase
MRTDRIFLSRRSLGEGGCSMKITEDVRKYAAQKGIDESVAIGEGLRDKAEEFRNAGAEIYSKP